MTDSKTYKQTDTEKRLFSAAQQVFAKKGRFGANTQEIADLANITKASLHYYYRRKEELYAAVFRYAFKESMFKTSEDLKLSDSFESTLHTFCNNMLSHYEKHPHLPQLWLQESLNGGQIWMETCREIESEDRAPWRIFIENAKSAIKSGEIKKVDPEQLLTSVVGSCVLPFVAEPIMAHFAEGLVEDKAKFLEERKKHVIELIYNGVKKA